MNARFGIGFSLPSGAVSRALLAGVLLPVLTAGCDLFGPSSPKIILEPFETTWLSERVPIDPVTHPLEEPPPGEVLIDSLFYRADLSVADTALGTGPMSLTLHVRLRNAYDEPVTIQVPGCPSRPRVYATIDRADPPIWNPSPNGDAFLGIRCAGGIFDVTVPPQDEVTGGVLVRPFDLSRFLPEGRYYFTLEYHTVDDLLLFPVGSADVRLGEPGLEFGVSVEGTGDGGVQAEVRVTNRNDVPMTLRWGGCSLHRLELYHDAGRSNLAEPWFVRGCPDFGANATVGPGETIRPDALTKEFDRGGIPDLPPGTYFLSVRLEINQHDYHIPAGGVLLK